MAHFNDVELNNVKDGNINLYSPKYVDQMILHNCYPGLGFSCWFLNKFCLKYNPFTWPIEGINNFSQTKYYN